MNNVKIRIRMLEAGIKQWELARLMGISEPALSQKFRDELPEEEQDRICDLIERMESRGKIIKRNERK